MTNIEEIKSTIVKSLVTANKSEIADAYKTVVACADCPYRCDCGEYDCFDYILDKLEADKNGEMD